MDGRVLRVEVGHVSNMGDQRRKGLVCVSALTTILQCAASFIDNACCSHTQGMTDTWLRQYVPW